MTNKIFRNMIITSLAVLALSMALVIGVLYNHLYDQVFYELKNEALIISQGVESEGAGYLNGLKSYNRITLIAEDGTVIYDSAADQNVMENHSDRQEFIDARKNGFGKAVRRSVTVSGKTLYYSTLLTDGSVLRVASEQSVVTDILNSMIMPVIVIVLAAILLSVYLSKKLTKAIVKPIVEIDVEHPEQSDTYDEIAPLLTKIHNQNTTIRLQMEKMAQRQNEFTAITENMSEGFVLVDRRANILSFNRSAVELLMAENVKREQSVLLLNRSEVFRKAVEGALSGKHIEAVMELGERYYQLLASGVYENGTVAGAVLIIMDITEKELHEKLRREFSANVSHELKTPLTSISGFAELMKNGLVDREHIPEFAGDIYNEAQRLIALVNDIIHISMLDDNEYSAEKTLININDTVGEVFMSLKDAAKKRNITLSLEGDNVDMESVYAILKEVIYNLVDNAIKYNKDGGEVKVTIKDTDKETAVTVADTGIGIPLEYQNRVFERFFRVDKSHSKEIGGTGLGLSIVKHGAAFLGADISIDSVPSKGTAITVKWIK